MPLANNSTGAGTGDGYNYSNPTMVAGILSPADGDVYVYGYDDGRKQVIIRKVSKSAQVPHKGMTAHPVYTNNLLSTYQKNAVIPKTIGATHNPQAVVPTVNDYLSAYSKNAVAPTVNDFLSGYNKNAVVPTVTDFLSAYVKNAVQPMVGTQQPVLSWGNPERFKQVLQNMSGDLRRGALHGKAGASAREEYEGKANYLPLSIKKLKGLAENPVLNSWTHALHGKAGTSAWEGQLLQNTKLKLDKLSENPVLNSRTHALHGKAGISAWEGKLLQNTKLKLDKLSENPVLNSWTHALHGKAGANPREDDKLPQTTSRLSGLADNPVLNSRTHALHGMAGINARLDGKLMPTIDRLKGLAENPVLNSWTHALHGKAGIQNRDSFTQTDNRTGVSKTYNELLPTTMLRLKGLNEDAVKNSWTHALHGKAGIQLRDSFTQTDPRTAVSKTYNNLLPTTVLRLKGLSEDPVKKSWTHALHGLVGVGGLGNFTTADGKFKTDRTKQIEDLRQLNKPLGALFGKAGIGGTGGFTFSDGRFKSNHTKLLEDLRSISSFKPSGALHGKAGSNIRGTASTVNTKGETLTFNNILNPTVRRLNALKDNPVLGSSTHALYGKAGEQGSIWSVTGKYATFHTQNKPIMTSPGGAAVSGAMSAATSLISGLADTMKNMLFGGTSWPMSKFYFYVIVGATELGFQSVEGLEAEIGVIEYRDGNSPILAKERIPGMITYSKVTLKKGMFSNDTNGANWFKELATDRLYTKRRNILIALLDHNHIPQFIWRYEGCFITKFTPANLDAESDSEIAVEEMEFVGRTFTTETLLGMAAGAAGAAISGAMNISF